jgi:UDP-N-acetylglucosamine--N-acetylmuramyl-(pentapeptide) pyrophosphoryl-undecaprenol N-acetylglucosamine transferase
MTGEWRLQLHPYLHDLPRYLAAADLVVCRAGALTLAEITARGIPSLLVPSPHVAHGHQEANARALARRGAAAVVREAELSSSRLIREVEGLLGDGEKLRLMARAARELGRPGAASRIAEAIVSHIHGSTGDRAPS